MKTIAYINSEDCPFVYFSEYFDGGSLCYSKLDKTWIVSTSDGYGIGAGGRDDRYTNMEFVSVEDKKISEQTPADFSVKSNAILQFKRDAPLPVGKYKIRFTRLLTQEYGDIPFSMKERIRE